MIKVFFVRHAQPDHDWLEDMTRPLTEEGIKDAQAVKDFFMDKKIDFIYSSPYKRTIDTIAVLDKEIHTDHRFRERECGKEGNNYEMLQKRWKDHLFHEEGGESLAMVQERNIVALTDILIENQNRNEEVSIVVGTHGTALSTILNYYEKEYNFDSFIRIIDWMPYIIELDFEGFNFVTKQEHLHIKKEFKRK